jgi:uncharacterized membrane protein
MHKAVTRDPLKLTSACCNLRTEEGQLWSAEQTWTVCFPWVINYAFCFNVRNFVLFSQSIIGNYLFVSYVSYPLYLIYVSCVSVYPIYLSIYLLSIYLLSIYVCLSVCHSIYLSIYLLFIYLYFSVIHRYRFSVATVSSFLHRHNFNSSAPTSSQLSFPTSGLPRRRFPSGDQDVIR